MIQFNELRITPDGLNLIVDVQVQELAYYNDIYIDSICFDTHTSYSNLGASQKAQVIYQAEENENKKHIRVTMDIDLLKDSIFFVYVRTKGIPSSDTPCGLKNETTMGITYNQYPLYSLIMKGLNSIEGCDLPRDYMDFIFRLKAFELSLKTGNYTKAVEYWKKFFTEEKQVVISNCGCRG